MRRRPQAAGAQVELGADAAGHDGYFSRITNINNHVNSKMRTVSLARKDCRRFVPLTRRPRRPAPRRHVPVRLVACVQGHHEVPAAHHAREAAIAAPVADFQPLVRSSPPASPSSSLPLLLLLLRVMLLPAHQRRASSRPHGTCVQEGVAVPPWASSCIRQASAKAAKAGRRSRSTQTTFLRGKR